jgi:Ca2+-binding RTX toxin-like protein
VGTGGNDVLQGTNGPDTINGGSGGDDIYGYGGNDTLTGGNNNDDIFGGAGNDTIDGNVNNDEIYGGSGNDTIHGNDNADTIYGGSGNDTMFGDDNVDTLIGGYGADTMNGGTNNDIFLYLDVKDTGDTINGFVSGDKLDLSAIASGDADGAFNWGGQQTGATVQAHSVTWYTSAGNVVVLADTDGILTTAEFMITLTGVTSVVAGDFTL